MSELKHVKVHWEIIEKYSVFRIIRFEVKHQEDVLGYFRIWFDPDTVNIAFYSETDKHGVLPPGMYKPIPKNHRMIRYIEEDLNKMGYTLTEAYRKITDGMLVGVAPFPPDIDLFY